MEAKRCLSSAKTDRRSPDRVRLARTQRRAADCGRYCCAALYRQSVWVAEMRERERGKGDAGWSSI